jgi:hypothetical protein
MEDDNLILADVGSWEKKNADDLRCILLGEIESFIQSRSSALAQI